MSKGREPGSIVVLRWVDGEDPIQDGTREDLTGELQDAVRQLGEEGWEMESSVTIEGQPESYTLKRPKQ
jgi:hypothetical protein